MGQLTDGGVRSGDLGGGVVTGPKLKNGAVSTEKLGAGAVTTGKLADGAVTAAKLASGLSAQLVKDVSYVTKTSALVFPSDSAEVTVECPAGKQAIGGGAAVSIDSRKIALVESAPVVDASGKRTGWTATAAEFDEEAADWTLEATAICAEL